MISILVYILVLVIVVALILWAVRTLGVPQPLNNVIFVGVTVVAVLIVVLLLLQLVGVSTGVDLPKP